MCRQRSSRQSIPRLAAVALFACGALAAQAQVVAPNYTLTTPSLLPEPEFSSRASLAVWGPVRLAATGSAGGSGLTLEAGDSWFARAAIGRTLDMDVLSVGGGYRFGDGDALSMVVTRQLGQERLGLAVRYDWRQAYLRLSYEQPLRSPGATPDRLRFSAGVRF